MLYVDIPTLGELRALVETRADACVSIYLPTTPLTQDVQAARVELGNLAKEALAQLDAAGLDKRRRWPLEEQLQELADDDGFWDFQAHSLAVLATPDSLRTWRLPNRLTAAVEVSDRFHLKPLLRAVTFPNEAFVLVLTENAVRLVEVAPDLPPQPVKVPELPVSATDCVRRASVNTRNARGRLHGSEGQKVLLGQYARQVALAVREVLAGHDAPLILAATEPLASIYRSYCTHPRLAAESILQSPVEATDQQLAALARPIMDGLYEAELAELRALFEQRAGQRRTTTDIERAARAATFGAVAELLVDIDAAVPGTVDEDTGAVSFADAASASSYGVIDAIAGRALLTGARVLAVRRGDIPGGGPLAAILRYADAG